MSVFRSKSQVATAMPSNKELENNLFKRDLRDLASGPSQQKGGEAPSSLPPYKHPSSAMLDLTPAQLDNELFDPRLRQPFNLAGHFPPPPPLPLNVLQPQRRHPSIRPTVFGQYKL
ncbi:hypothetical protein JCM10213_007087 [Rhodosporidiobolus nylandii]